MELPICDTNPAPAADVLWRAEADVDDRYATFCSYTGEFDGFAYRAVPIVTIRLYPVPVLRRTPKGAWVEDDMLRERFILLTANKRYACETQEEAIESLKARKRRQVKILTAQLRSAQAALDHLENSDAP